MTINTSKSKNELSLRLSAEELLRQGTAPPNRGWTISGDALTCLHQLASNQANAADALKFLHELQVYQVELDLQHEQLEQNRQELAVQLDRHIEMVQRAAVGLLSTDVNGVIADSNLRAASLLGVAVDALIGRGMDSFLTPASRPILHDTLARLNAGAEEWGCVVYSDKGGAAGQGLRLTATPTQHGSARVVALVDLISCDQPSYL